jgi:hypothetical protein
VVSEATAALSPRRQPSTESADSMPGTLTARPGAEMAPGQGALRQCFNFFNFFFLLKNQIQEEGNEIRNVPTHSKYVQKKRESTTT